MKPICSWTVLAIGSIAAVTLACGEDAPIVQPPPPPPPAANVVMSLDEFALSVGGTVDLDVTVTDASGNAVANPTVTWSSSDDAVISVAANGTMATVTAAAAGSATITATSETISATSDGDVVASALYAADVQPIFNANCTGCHGGAMPQANMNLEASVAYGNIVDVPSGELGTMDRIEPGDPLQSYLIHKLRGTQLSVGGSGGQMPLGMTPLPDATIAIIRAWTQEGAQNN